jgi:long-subunit acyl-CoA synthetase (AMP-forming)
MSTLKDFLQIICEIGEVQPDHIICGPVFLQQLAAYGTRVSSYVESVKTIFCTGAAFVEQYREAIESSLERPVLNYYGLTETGGIVLAESLSTRKPHCLPLPCQGVKIEMEQIFPESSVHHLIIKSPNLFLGYLGSPLQRRSFFDTGDLVKITPQGDLFLCGRNDGAVKASSTEWLYPILLENWLKARFPTVDFHVLSLEVSGGFALKVCCESFFSFSEAGISINKEIEEQLGTEYIPHAWEQVTIQRNPLGKILDIQKK